MKLNKHRSFINKNKDKNSHLNIYSNQKNAMLPPSLRRQTSSQGQQFTLCESSRGPLWLALAGAFFPTMYRNKCTWSTVKTLFLKTYIHQLKDFNVQRSAQAYKTNEFEIYDWSHIASYPIPPEYILWLRCYGNEHIKNVTHSKPPFMKIAELS